MKLPKFVILFVVLPMMNLNCEGEEKETSKTSREIVKIADCGLLGIYLHGLRTLEDYEKFVIENGKNMLTRMEMGLFIALDLKEREDFSSLEKILKYFKNWGGDCRHRTAVAYWALKLNHVDLDLKVVIGHYRTKGPEETFLNHAWLMDGKKIVDFFSASDTLYTPYCYVWWEKNESGKWIPQMEIEKVKIELYYLERREMERREK